MEKRKESLCQCKQCGSKLLELKSNYRETVLWCEKCDKKYLWKGPVIFATPAGTSEEEVAKKRQSFLVEME